VEAFEKVIVDKRESILLQLGGCGIALFMDDVRRGNILRMKIFGCES
jgi:hypothetical protein